MRVARLLCQWRAPKSTSDEVVCVLCGIDENSRMIDGQWMGYLRTGRARYPFLLEGTGSQVVYASDDQARTDIGQKQLKVGEMFFIGSWERGEPDYIYEIVSLHVLAGPSEQPSAAVSLRSVP